MAITIRLDHVHTLHQVPYVAPEKKVAILSEAFFTLVQYLQETCARLEEKLITCSKLDLEAHKSFPNPSLDIWSVLDTVRRIFPIIEQLGIVVSSSAYVRLQEDVKGIRDSFQHLDERLIDHYQQPLIGASIFGDFSWRYRSSLEELERLYICKSGITIGQDQLHETVVDYKPIDNSSQVGIYSLGIRYVIRVTLNQKKKQYEYKTVSICLDELIDFINEVVFTLDQGNQENISKLKAHLNLAELPIRALQPAIIELTLADKKTSAN
jgi:hypothetical protein